MASDWPLKPLADVCSLITDGSHFSPKTCDEGYPYVTVKDIVNSTIRFDSAARVSKEAFEELVANGCAPREDDILFAKDGATMGKVALVPDDREFVVLSSLAIVRANPAVVIPAFLALVMGSDAFYANALERKSGNAITRVVLKVLKTLPVPVPPIPVQRRIADLMKHVDSHLANMRAEIRSLDLVKTAVLGEMSATTIGRTVPLRDLIHLEYGKALKADDRNGGSVDVLGSAGSTGRHDVALFHGEGIVVGRKGVDSRASLTTPVRSDSGVSDRGGYSGWGGAGAIRWADGPHWVIDTAYSVAPKSHDVSLKAIYWLLVAADLPRFATMTTLPGLTRDAVYSIDVTLPDNLSDVVELLEDLDRAQVFAINEVASLSILRGIALESLLEGAVGIDSTYDSLLEVVA